MRQQEAVGLGAGWHDVFHIQGLVGSSTPSQLLCVSYLKLPWCLRYFPITVASGISPPTCSNIFQAGLEGIGYAAAFSNQRSQLSPIELEEAFTEVGVLDGLKDSSHFCVRWPSWRRRLQSQSGSSCSNSLG